jgi:hypothetical protein
MVRQLLENVNDRIVLQDERMFLFCKAESRKVSSFHLKVNTKYT